MYRQEFVMKKNINISSTEYNAVLQEFYEYFETGYKFEEFLKLYLEKIGLDEVVVTQRSRDGGIDLMAVRNGIGDLGGQDFITYCIQAKKYKPSNTINIKDVRELAYVANKKKAMGIFITTAKFSKSTKEEFGGEQVTPIILIDGKTLVDSCIDNELGFVYKPCFSKQYMDRLMFTENPIIKKNISDEQTQENTITVEKKITANDIRARILSLPKIILDHIPNDKNTINVCFNNEFSKELTINKGRNYLAGVTEVYRKYGLLTEDNSIFPAISLWKLDGNQLDIDIRLA